MSKKLIFVCLINFFIAAFLGLVLRYILIHPLPINYRFLTHAHSHIGMLGWIYLMLYTFLVYYFVPVKKPIYVHLFWLTQIAVLGMLFSFPFQGYAVISISFSTLHIFCSYYFVYRIWNDLIIGNKLINCLVKTALVFMLLSTLGVWCLGPAVGLLGSASAFYQIAIQFFLHFQFNGWFIVAVIAILMYQLKIDYNKRSLLFLKLLIAATILNFALPVQWFANHPILYFINGLGVILQLVALVIFFRIIRIHFQQLISRQPSLVKHLYYFALLCFVIKISLQTISIIPNFSVEVYQYRNFVIGFIHLLMLGVISGFLFAFLLQTKTIKPSLSAKIGLYIFLMGFTITEGILLVQGCLFYLQKGMLPNYYYLLYLASILLPLGIAIVVVGYIKQKQYELKSP